MSCRHDQRVHNETPAEKKAYMRGYQNAASKLWPTDWPPAPPESVVRRMLESLRAIRDHADNLRAQLEPDDKWIVALDGMLDESAAAALGVTDWLTGRAMLADEKR